MSLRIYLNTSKKKKKIDFLQKLKIGMANYYT